MPGSQSGGMNRHVYPSTQGYESNKTAYLSEKARKQLFITKNRFCLNPILPRSTYWFNLQDFLSSYQCLFYQPRWQHLAVQLGHVRCRLWGSESFSSACRGAMPLERRIIFFIASLHRSPICPNTTCWVLTFWIMYCRSHHCSSLINFVWSFFYNFSFAETYEKPSK